MHAGGGRMEEYIRAHNTLPGGWQAYHWEMEPNRAKGIALIRGSTPEIKNGKRKFPRKEHPTDRGFYIEVAAVERWMVIEAEKRGICVHCWGEGKHVVSISVNAPTTYRPCTYCDGTGKPKERALAPSAAP